MNKMPSASVLFLTLIVVVVSSILVKGEDCLSSHNKYRAQHGVQPLQHNSTLERFAMQRVQYMAQTDIFAHPPDLRYGENLFRSSGMVPSCDAAVTAWYDENRYYNYEAGQFSPATGHFTQLIWRGTHFVGCAAAQSRGRGGIYIACNYYPPGNIVGRFRENVPRRVNNYG